MLARRSVYALPKERIRQVGGDSQALARGKVICSIKVDTRIQYLGRVVDDRCRTSVYAVRVRASLEER